MDKHGLEKLPESSAEKGKLEKELRSFAGVIENDPHGQPQPIPYKTPPKSNHKEIRLAPDSHLHAIHTAILELPFFALSETHKKKLLKRGLTEEAITKNQYRTVPDSLDNPTPYIELYEKKAETLPSWPFSRSGSIQRSTSTSDYASPLRCLTEDWP